MSAFAGGATVGSRPLEGSDAVVGLLPRLADLAATAPERVAIDDGGQRTTFAELWAAVLATTDAFGARGPGRIGARAIAVLAAPGAELSTVVLAALASARPLLVLDPHAPEAFLRSMVRHADADLVVADRGTISLATVVFRHRDVIAADELRSAVPSALTAAPAGEPALLLPGHGRVPHLDAIPRAALEEVTAAAASRSGLTALDRVASLMGPWSEAGLIALLAPLHCGATVVPVDTQGAGCHALPHQIVDGAIDALVLTPTLAQVLRPLALPPVRLLVVAPPDKPGGDERRAPAEAVRSDPSVVELFTGLRAAALPSRGQAGPEPDRLGLAERVLGRVVAVDAGLVGRRFPLPDGPIPVDTLGWTSALTDSWSIIRGELDALVAAGIELPDIDDVNNSPQGAIGPWSTYVLYAFGSWVAPNAARCPATTALIADVPDVEIAGFTVLAPGTHIPGHRGPYRSVRYQLGVRIPEPEGACRLRVARSVLIWRDGQALAFDDAVDHEAWNDSDASRYVLFVQTTWPVTGLAGRAHRGLHRVLARAAGDLAGRATKLDRSLNGTT